MRSVDPGQAEQEDLARMNRSAAGKLSHITLVNGESLFGISPLVAPDSTTWLDPKTNRLIITGTDRILDISLVRADKGAMTGLGVAVLTGAALGTLRAVLEGGDPPEEVLSLTLKEKVAIYPFAFTVFSSFVTVPLGAIIGSRDQYRFYLPEAADWRR